MPDLLLIVRMNGARVALPATDVEAVVELEGLTRVPRTGPHIAGLAALRSRVLTVIDCLASLERGSSRAQGLSDAIVVPSEGHHYALLVERVEDVVDASGPTLPVQAPLGAGWARVVTGMVEADEDLLMLVDPHALIEGPPALAA